MNSGNARELMSGCFDKVNASVREQRQGTYQDESKHVEDEWCIHEFEEEMLNRDKAQGVSLRLKRAPPQVTACWAGA